MDAGLVIVVNITIVKMEQRSVVQKLNQKNAIVGIVQNDLSMLWK